MYKDWNGFKLLETELNGRLVKIVFPNCEPNGKLVVKTEYFEDFPNTQIALVEKGYHLIYIANQTRWHVPEDTEAKKALIDYMADNYGTERKAALIGMSYGGLFSLRWAAEHPETVGAIYLDAPVCSLSFTAERVVDASLPSLKTFLEGETAKHFKAYNVNSVEELRNHPKSPLNNYQPIAEAQIPILAIRSGQDQSVIPETNIDIFAERLSAAGGNIQVIRRDLYGHHPHGLDDPTPLTGFILDHYPEFKA